MRHAVSKSGFDSGLVVVPATSAMVIAISLAPTMIVVVTASVIVIAIAIVLAAARFVLVAPSTVIAFGMIMVALVTMVLLRQRNQQRAYSKRYAQESAGGVLRRRRLLFGLDRHDGLPVCSLLREGKITREQRTRANGN